MLNVLRCFRNVASLLVLVFPTLAWAHPYLDVLPLPPASIPSGSSYTLILDLFPGDTPVASIQLDFELSSPAAFGAPSALMSAGFSFVYDGVADPLHFSIVGNFAGNPLEEFGEFPVGQVTMEAGSAGGELLMLDSSVIVAFEGDVPEEFVHEEFSNVRFSDVVVQVVPEPTLGLLFGMGLATLASRARSRRLPR